MRVPGMSTPGEQAGPPRPGAVRRRSARAPAFEYRYSGPRPDRSVPRTVVR